MRSTNAAILVFIIAVAACAIPVTRTFSAIAAETGMSDWGYVMVGGQNGTWFGPGQAPRLERIDLGNYFVTPLVPAPTEGTVWGGGWNGSQWLISGWGEDLQTANGSNPYIFLYNGLHQVVGGSLNQYQAETTWHGGDIFGASSDGDDWLVSGLGSGNLTSYGNSNHMSLALFNGTDFTDLSAMLPNQRDAILYTNAWNGKYWLIGGGFYGTGALYSFNGSNIVDLAPMLSDAVRSFGSVQSVAWNGYYWLVGGVNFLAAYDGHRFQDLTPRLDDVLELNGGCCGPVNAIAWDGEEWVLGGGTPVAQVSSSHAWLAKYAAGVFTDLTSKIAPTELDRLQDSSILSIAASDRSWIIGGYSNGKGLLYEYTEKSFSNISYLVDNYTYVNWVGAHFLPPRTPTFGKPGGIPQAEPEIALLSLQCLRRYDLRLR